MLGHVRTHARAPLLRSLPWGVVSNPTVGANDAMQAWGSGMLSEYSALRGPYSPVLSQELNGGQPMSASAVASPQLAAGSYAAGALLFTATGVAAPATLTSYDLTYMWNSTLTNVSGARLRRRARSPASQPSQAGGRRPPSLPHHSSPGLLMYDAGNSHDAEPVELGGAGLDPGCEQWWRAAAAVATVGVRHAKSGPHSERGMAACMAASGASDSETSARRASCRSVCIHCIMRPRTAEGEGGQKQNGERR